MILVLYCVDCGIKNISIHTRSLIKKEYNKNTVTTISFSKYPYGVKVKKNKTHTHYWNPILFLLVVGFELKASCLIRQALCHLSHTFTSFCSGYFGSKVLLFAQASLDSKLPILSFPP
jgi:hypothetical protein